LRDKEQDITVKGTFDCEMKNTLKGVENVGSRLALDGWDNLTYNLHVWGCLANQLHTKGKD